MGNHAGSATEQDGYKNLTRGYKNMKETELAEKMAKLPKWAQEHINNLTRFLQHEREDRAEFGKAMTGGQKTNIIVNAYSLHENRNVYLPDSSSVSFMMEDGSQFTIQFDRNYDNGSRKDLRLSQDRSIRGTLAVAPSASNVVYIFSKER